MVDAVPVREGKQRVASALLAVAESADLSLSMMLSLCAWSEACLDSN